jgi:hypothetical protein
LVEATSVNGGIVLVGVIGFAKQNVPSDGTSLHPRILKHDTKPWRSLNNPTLTTSHPVLLHNPYLFIQHNAEMGIFEDFSSRSK